MSTERQSAQEWVSGYVQQQHPKLVFPCLRAADAFDRTAVVGSLSQGDAELLKDAARNRSSLLSEYAASLLGRLAQRFPLARDAIAQLSKDAQLRARISALVALESVPVCDLHVTVGRVALNDRSRRVRELAADKIRGWRLWQLLPDVEQAIARESDVALRSALELQRDLLRNGYSVRPAHGGVSIVYQAAGTGLISTWVREAEFRTKGIAAIARQLGVDLTGRLAGVATGGNDLEASKLGDGTSVKT
jgi:hypothetical protein